MFLSTVFLWSCGRFEKKAEKQESGDERIVSLAKQYTELLYALGVADHLVAVDLSSTYPPETAELTTVGYHRALSAEGVMAVDPTLILHDHNIGPEHVVTQLEQLKAPLHAFENNGKSWEGTLDLIDEMSVYFDVETTGDSLRKVMTLEMNQLMSSLESTVDTPEVLVIHFGRATNTYLVMTSNSTGAKMIEIAGGKVPFIGKGGMRPLSPEVFAEMNPDIILMTNFGYDRLNGEEAILELPGVRNTKAAQNHRIYRIEEHDLVYFGPRTPQNIRLIRSFIEDEA